MDEDTERLLYNGADLFPDMSAGFRRVDQAFREAIPRFGIVPARGGLELHLERMHRRFRVLQAAIQASATPDHVPVPVFIASLLST